MLSALRPRPEILSHGRGGAQTARTAPVPRRSPVPRPAASAASSPNHPTPCSHGSAGLGKAAVSRWSLRASAQRCHGPRTLSLRTGAVTVLGRAPLEEGSAGEKFTEDCERPLNPSSAVRARVCASSRRRRVDSQLLPTLVCRQRNRTR